MSTKIKSISLETTVPEACNLFWRDNISHIPVLAESGEVIGMFSMTDALRMFQEKVYSNPTLSREEIRVFQLSEFITSEKLHEINENEPIKKASKAMKKAGVKSLLVYNDKKKLSGIITESDLPEESKD